MPVLTQAEKDSIETARQLEQDRQDERYIAADLNAALDEGSFFTVSNAAVNKPYGSDGGVLEIIKNNDTSTITQVFHDSHGRVWIRITGPGDGSDWVNADDWVETDGSVRVLELETGKAEQDAVDALQVIVAGKAEQSDLNDLALVVEGKASHEDVAGRMRWAGKHVEGNTYQENDMVADGSWTMVANKETTDTAAPRPIGIVEYLYKGAGLTMQQVTGKQLVFGQRYTSDVSFFANGYKLDVIAGNSYQVVLVKDSLGVKEIEFVNEFTATVSGIKEFGLISRPETAGVTFDILAIVTQPEPPETVTIANYVYKETSSDPDNGDASHNSSGDILKISTEDKDNIDRTALLETMHVGALIEFGGLQWSVQSVSNQGDYYEFTVAPHEIAEENEALMTFKVTPEVTISYESEVDYFLNDSRVSGLFIVDGSWENVDIDNNAYGIDLLVQAAYVSPDWELIFTNKLTGGGGIEKQVDLPAPAPAPEYEPEVIELDIKGKLPTRGECADAFKMTTDPDWTRNKIFFMEDTSGKHQIFQVIYVADGAVNEVDSGRFAVDRMRYRN